MLAAETRVKEGTAQFLSHKTITAKSTEKELTEGFKLTTNNRMELLAAIIGLEALKNRVMLN